jgi:hypothetical protein
MDQLIFPCDCANGDYLRITWEDDDPEYRYLWIESAYQRHKFRSRVAGAWRVLTGKPHSSTEVLLSEKTVVALHAFLSLKPVELSDD